MNSNIRLDKFSVRQVDRALRKALGDLTAFSSPVIERAPDRIAHMKRGTSFEGLTMDRSIVLNMLAREKDVTDNQSRIALEIVLDDPDNYAHTATDFAATETVMNLIFGGKKPTGLQLAANYGPYLLYLQEQRSLGRFWGVDRDATAVRYGRMNGINVLLTDAAALPFTGSSFDVVISSNFLQFEYLDLIKEAIKLGILDYSRHRFPVMQTAFEMAVIGEIHRVLKPGGWLISDGEIFGQGTAPRFPPFSQMVQRFSPEVRKTFGLRDVCALQK